MGFGFNCCLCLVVFCFVLHFGICFCDCRTLVCLIVVAFIEVFLYTINFGRTVVLEILVDLLGDFCVLLFIGVFA